ncbi:MAG: CPBP family glutamic-type intramembrane protease [Myxococcota bacterium]
MSQGGESRARPEAERKRGLLPTKPDPLTSLVLVIPVFLVYHLGILVIDLRNGVDLVSQATFALLEQSLLAYVGVTLGLAACLVGALAFLRQRGKVRPVALFPVLAESTALAFGMLVSVGWASAKLFMVLPLVDGARPLGPVEKLVMSAGAGFHEELVFRVILYGGMAELGRRGREGRRPLTAILGAALLSSLLFSAVHYIGSLSDAFTFASFFFRFLAGVYLVTVYELRGFAVAVYTHTIYDLLVFFLL